MANEARKKAKLTGSVTSKDLAIFVRQFSVMIDAGLPLVQCLEILGSANDNKFFASVLTVTRQDIEAGATLADAMRKHPKVFDELFCNMIAAGEAGGILDTILKRLATYIEKSVKLQQQIKGAMMYPIAVVSIAGIVITVILWKVIPTFAAMFQGLGATLPLPTRCRRCEGSGSTAHGFWRWSCSAGVSFPTAGRWEDLSDLGELPTTAARWTGSRESARPETHESEND